MVFTMAVAWGRCRRIKEQVLAEYLYELAVYAECKTGFYGASKGFDERFNALVHQQIAVANKQ